jgi:hypothetical protein
MLGLQEKPHRNWRCEVCLLADSDAVARFRAWIPASAHANSTEARVHSRSSIKRPGLIPVTREDRYKSFSVKRKKPLWLQLAPSKEGAVSNFNTVSRKHS